MNYFKLNFEFESRTWTNSNPNNQNREGVVFFSQVRKLKVCPKSNFSKFKISNLKFDSNSRVQNWSLAQTSDSKP